MATGVSSHTMIQVALLHNMQPVNIGIIGLGNVGSGALTILTENAPQIAAKLGFPFHVAAVCSRHISAKQLPPASTAR